MSELDKTIEELEAELQEATAGDKKADAVVPNKEDGDEEDVGGPTPEKDENMVGKLDPAKKVKKDKGEPTKGSAEPEKTDSVEESTSQEPKTKTDFVNIFGKMTKTEMKNMYSSYQTSLQEDEESSEEDDEKVKESFEERISNISVSEDVEALVQGEELSEDFLQKAETIFESAIKSKLRTEVARLEEENAVSLQEEVETFKSELTEKVDNYLSYVVKEWMEENKLAVENGLKSEIAEEFISGMKNLFEEHYIDVPDEKYNVLEEQSEKIEKLEQKLNESLEDNIKMSNNIGSLVRDSLIYEVSEDLTHSETEKFKSLCEDIEYTDNESFISKLNTIKENYFGSKYNSVEENIQSVDTVDETPQSTIVEGTSVSKYVSAISRSSKFYK